LEEHEASDTPRLRSESFLGECKPRLGNAKVVKDLTSGNSLQNRWKSVSNQSQSGIRIDAMFTSASVYPGYGFVVGIV
jgi:hypothetical protein